MSETTDFLPIIQSFNRDSFSTEGPYAYLQSLSDPFVRQCAEDAMAERAKQVGVTGFKRRYAKFIASQRTAVTAKTTAFSEQPLSLSTGKWCATDQGIYRTDDDGRKVYACTHPILIAARTRDIDTGEFCVVIAYRLPGQMEWRELTVPLTTIATSRSIVALAAYGIAVTSITASNLVQYFADLQQHNADAIPCRCSVSRLGHFPGYGTAPYDPNLVATGNAEYHNLYSSVSPTGDFDDWLNTANRCRRDSVMVRLMLAASFASVLLAPLHCQCFLVHLWGKTGYGKTVMMQLAASVWGNPEIGMYVLSHNATTVGLEYTAAFLNQYPLCLNEVQQATANGHATVNIYALAEGSGRSRGRKDGGILEVPTWRNVILSNGEWPITSASSGGGAINRVISIDCTNLDPAFDDGGAVVRDVCRTYGHAGKVFIENLYANEDNLALAREVYQEYCSALNDSQASCKQIPAAGVILTADFLARRWVYGDEHEYELLADDILPHLATESDVDSAIQALDLLRDFVAANHSRFVPKEHAMQELYGIIDNDKGIVWFIKTKFDKFLAENNFNPKAILGQLRKLGFIADRGSKAATQTKTINGQPCNCVGLKLRIDDTQK